MPLGDERTSARQQLDDECYGIEHLMTLLNDRGLYLEVSGSAKEQLGIKEAIADLRQKTLYLLPNMESIIEYIRKHKEYIVHLPFTGYGISIARPNLWYRISRLDLTHGIGEYRTQPRPYHFDKWDLWLWIINWSMMFTIDMHTGRLNLLNRQAADYDGVFTFTAFCLSMHVTSLVMIIIKLFRMFFGKNVWTVPLGVLLDEACVEARELQAHPWHFSEEKAQAIIRLTKTFRTLMNSCDYIARDRALEPTTDDILEKCQPDVLHELSAKFRVLLGIRRQMLEDSMNTLAVMPLGARRYHALIEQTYEAFHYNKDLTRFWESCWTDRQFQPSETNDPDLLNGTQPVWPPSSWNERAPDLVAYQTVWSGYVAKWTWPWLMFGYRWELHEHEMSWNWLGDLCRYIFFGED